MQRFFNLFTEETRVCYEYVKAYCTDPEVKRVVLIAIAKTVLWLRKFSTSSMWIYQQMQFLG